MKSKHNYKAIGVMSGTSLDGLDLACCEFRRTKTKWKFEILEAITIAYPPKWKSDLISAPGLHADRFMQLDAAFGHYIGRACNDFIKSKKLGKIDLIASHGHTIFHQPGKLFTTQIGNGNSIYAETNIQVVSDFRSLDVAMGGQGAPLVPVGDRRLFDKYEICLNLGGIANLSMEKKGERLAYDICFVNMGLNFLAAERNKAMDRDGEIASGGKIDHELLGELKTSYTPFRKKRPSLAREDFETRIEPLLKNASIALEDRMRTFCESIGNEIAGAIPEGKKKKMLVTGGGAFNKVLMKVIREKATNIDVIVPQKKIIQFKEALVFAFLGVLRTRGEINVLRSVTKARADSSSGVIAGEC